MKPFTSVFLQLSMSSESFVNLMVDTSCFIVFVVVVVVVVVWGVFFVCLFVFSFCLFVMRMRVYCSLSSSFFFSSFFFGGGGSGGEAVLCDFCPRDGGG